MIKNDQTGHDMRVIGIDPGLRNLGWGVIDTDGNRMTHVGNGICHSTTGELALRLLSLHKQLSEVMARFTPDAAAVEQTFVNKDAVATLKLGQARGIALLVPAQAGLPIGEYAPNAVKKTVVGVGHADKKQVEHMVKMQLPGVSIKGAKASMAILSALGADGVSRAIALGDWNAIKSAKGVGPKGAQRVVNELKDKAASVMALSGQGAATILPDPATPMDTADVIEPVEIKSAPAPSNNAAQSEALSALNNLGYAPGEAASAVAQAMGEDADLNTSGLIRAALKLLAPKG